ncbi:superoxide dismutase [Chloroflexi bacterium TSY]|nr:superoxide dismutase [Chloroflexi bacterium TSY]
MKPFTIVLVSLFLTLVIATPLAAISNITQTADAFPDLIPLPNGWRPEGITSGTGATAYVGSLGTGAIYRVDLATGEGEVAVPPQDGRIAVGLAYDQRSDLIFAAGGRGGAGYVYHASNGETAGLFQFTTETSFVNDVIITKDAAFFTDSFRPFLYKVPLGPAGSLPDASAVETIALSGDFVFVPGAFNTNGIEATPNGKTLIIVHSGRAELYKVDPQTGNATLIDLGGESVASGDGLLLEGKTLYVMQNRLNKIGIVQLNPQLTSGTIAGSITDPDFDVPTTIAGFGNAIYAVNARFGTPPMPDTEYDIVRVTK